MKLKIENGQVVTTEVDGPDGQKILQPVYVYDDGREVGFDAPATVQKIKRLSDERDEHRQKLQQAEKTLKAFEGLDVEAARKALETVKNLDDKQLVAAGEVERIKTEAAKAAEEQKRALMEAHTKQLQDLETAVGERDKTIHKLMIVDRFSQSPWFATEQPKTILPPDVAFAYFGQNFKIEQQDKDGAPRVVGYIDGEKIYSRAKPGELADFDEAMSTIIERYPMKDRILRSYGGAGSGAGGGTGGGAGGAETYTRQQWLQKTSAAKPDERRELIQRAARGEITVQG